MPQLRPPLLRAYAAVQSRESGFEAGSGFRPLRACYLIQELNEARVWSSVGQVPATGR
jgi:hypothetical protein